MRQRYDMMGMMWYIRYAVFVCFLFIPVIAGAHNPKIIETPTQHETLPLNDPAISQALYGTLEKYPHMFEFAVSQPVDFFAEILVPDLESLQNNVSGILLRVNLNGSVSEVARLRAREASWESFYEPFGGDHYRRGSSYRGVLDPGLYRIEVSTPDNIGKYVLAVGTEEDFSGTSYWELLRTLVRVKVFFEKSPLRIVESPFVYGPLLGLGTLSGAGWWIFRRRRVRYNARI